MNLLFLVSHQNVTRIDQKNITSNKSEQSIKGAIVYKRDTGMAFKVVHMSHANGIAHYKLLCLETGSKYYLSKFAVEQNYTNEDAKTEQFGMRIVRRLSKMCGK